MKLKLVVVDFQLSPRAKRVLATIAVPAILLGSGAVAYADMHKWSAGEVLKAADLNGNFGDVDTRMGALDTRIGALEGQAGGYVDLSSAQSIDGDKTFTGTVSLGGTLEVQGFGSVVSNAFNARSIATFNNDGASNSAILFNTGAPASTNSVRGLYMGSADQLFGIARFDAAGAAAPTFDLTVTSNGKVWIGGGPSDAHLVLESTQSNQYDQAIAFKDPGSTWWIGGRFASPVDGFGIGRTNAKDDLVINQSGQVGIGTTTPAYALDVNGYIRGTNFVPSDAKLKANVRTIEHALADVGRLRGVRFTWKKDGEPSIGVIAQELEQVYPELVSTGADHIKSVDYAKLAGVLVEATKELEQRTTAAEARNAVLEARLRKIEAALDQRTGRR